MRTTRLFHLTVFILSMLLSFSCDDVLEPKPVDLLTNDLVLNEPSDVGNVEIGIYNAFRDMAAVTVIAGDFTADMLIFNGTFSQYRELGTKQISSANASVNALYKAIYKTIYVANFMLERLPNVAGVPTAQKNQASGTAHFLRGYAYFIAVNTFGGVPLVLTTDIEANRNIPRASIDEILAQITDDYSTALGLVPEDPANEGFVGVHAVQAALARMSLYQGNWSQAASFATQVIESGDYALEPDFATVVTEDFTSESILDAAYTIADDPGTDGNFGLNNLFVGRREIIPSNETTLALTSTASGKREASMSFDLGSLNGTDNGWSVAKYGTADAGNNDVMVFRLAEMYLIRAEARAQLDNVTGTSSAQSDINVLRERSKKRPEDNVEVPSVGKSQMLRLIEEERRYELAFEGHRWYDLKRTGRLDEVMSAFSPNWRNNYQLWPIPQSEIQNNPALVGNQNPGY